MRFVPAPSSREAVRGADVVCTATRAVAPLFERGDLKGEAHVNAVGAYRHDMCEVPPAAFGAARVVAVDQLEAALAEAGDLRLALDAGLIDRDRLVGIAELLDGTPPGSGPTRGASGSAGAAPTSGYENGRGAGGPTIFKSVGVAAQDWAMAELIVRRLLEQQPATDGRP